MQRSKHQKNRVSQIQPLEQFEIARDIYMPKLQSYFEEQIESKLQAVEQIDNKGNISPTDLEMSLRRSTRIHVNKGISILKDPNNSSVLRPSISNQKSHCSRNGSLGKRDDQINSQTDIQKTGRIMSSVNQSKVWTAQKGHCEHCREEQLLNQPDFGNLNNMHPIHELVSDQSSPIHPLKRQHSNYMYHQSSPFCQKSSNSDTAFQAGSQLSDTKRVDLANRETDKLFEKTPIITKIEDNIGTQTDFAFPDSQEDVSIRSRVGTAKLQILAGSSNGSHSMVGGTPDIIDMSERRSMNPHLFNKMITTTPVNQRKAHFALQEDREANTQKGDYSFLNGQSIRISDSKSVASRQQFSVAGPFCESFSYFEPQVLAKEEIDRISKLHLTKRKSSIMVNSPASSPQRRNKDQINNDVQLSSCYGGDSSVLIQSPLNRSRRKNRDSCSLEKYKAPAILINAKSDRPDEEIDQVKQSKKNNLITLEDNQTVKVTNRKKVRIHQVKLQKNGRPIIISKSPSPAEQYLKVFINDSKQKIKSNHGFSKNLAKNSSVNHLLPKKQANTSRKMIKNKKGSMKNSDSLISFASQTSSQTGGAKSQINVNSMQRSPRDKMLKEFQQKYLKKNTLSVLKEQIEEISLVNDTPLKTIESQTFLKSIKVIDLQSPLSKQGMNSRMTSNNNSQNSKKQYIPRLKTKQINGFTLKIAENSSERNQHSTDDLFQNVQCQGAAEIISPVPPNRPRFPSKNQSYSDLAAANRNKQSKNAIQTDKKEIDLEFKMNDCSNSSLFAENQRYQLTTSLANKLNVNVAGTQTSTCINVMHKLNSQSPKSPSGIKQIDHTTSDQIYKFQDCQKNIQISTEEKDYHNQKNDVPIELNSVLKDKNQNQNKADCKEFEVAFDCYCPSYYNAYPLKPITMPNYQDIIIDSEKLEVHFGNSLKKQFNWQYVTLQKNGKLLIHSAVDPLNPHTCSHFRDMVSSDVLDNFWELGNVYQTNRDAACKLVASIDLQFLFPGTKVFLREKSRELEIKIYEFERADYQDDQAQPFGFSQQWQKIAFLLLIKFKDSNTLEKWFQLINTLLQSITCGYFELQNKKIDEQPIKNKIIFQQAIYGSLLTCQTDFYNFCSMRENTFLDQVDTGDVILFRSNNQFGTWITRTVSRSHFDHVGIALRFGNEVQDLYILESVGEDGVRLTSWLCARGYIGNFFNKVGFRKLNYELEDRALEDFDVFRKKSCGKKYALNFSKLITTKSEAVSQSLQAHISDDRKFFCSELVAKSFKVLGLMKDLSKSSTRYYPGCFEPGGQVDQDLKQGISLGPVFNLLADWSFFLDPEEKLSLNPAGK